MKPYISTTALLKMAHESAGGNIAKALDALHDLRFDYIEASSAMRVLSKKMQKHPGASTFVIERDGFVALK